MKNSTIVLFFVAAAAGCNSDGGTADCSSACSGAIQGSATMQAGALCEGGRCGTPDLVTKTAQSCAAACAAVKLGGKPMMCAAACSYVPASATAWSYAWNAGTLAGLAAYSDGAGHTEQQVIASCDTAPDPNALPGYPFAWASCCCAATF
jgi:hypothetical protein